MSSYREFLSPTPDLDGKSILVTGGTGTFGRAFVKTVLERYNPRRIIVFSRDELKQSEMAYEFPADKFPAIRYFIGDVRDSDRLEMAFREVDYVIHAAALKQVDIAEYNPIECINTNVMGAQNVVQAAIRCGVEKVVALSTDKAANPINLYGASKLASDKIFVAANNLSGSVGTRFSAVRYGNVLGSRGSVVPLYRRLIAEKVDSLPITDPAMTRFWITIQQAVNMVLSTIALMQGGEIYIPKIPSMCMTDMARAMAPHLDQHVIGIRPGEKLHEIMVTTDDARVTTELADRYVIHPSFNFWGEGESVAKSMQRVDEDFVYTSENNDEWLDAETLNQLIAPDDSRKTE